MPHPEAVQPRFEDVTETTGIPVTDEAAQMMYTRYAVGAEMASGRRVLELACGGGNGLGLVGARARYLVGGDLSMPLLRAARAHYGQRFPLTRLSAEALPFRDGAFDIVLFFEASYYVGDTARAFREVSRVLARGGSALLVSANPQRPDFIRSPYSVHYHSADELRRSFGALGFAVVTEGGFPVSPPRAGPFSRLKAVTFRVARQVLGFLGLVPETLRGRARMKRLVLGRLKDLPAELPMGLTEVAERVPLEVGTVPGFKVLYVTALKPVS